MVGWQDQRDLESIGLAWVEHEAGWATGVRVVERYVIVFFLSAGVDEGVILPSGFLKDVTFRERVLAYVSHLLLPPLVVAGFLLPYL